MFYGEDPTGQNYIGGTVGGGYGGGMPAISDAVSHAIPLGAFDIYNPRWAYVNPAKPRGDVGISGSLFLVTGGITLETGPFWAITPTGAVGGSIDIYSEAVINPLVEVGAGLDRHLSMGWDIGDSNSAMVIHIGLSKSLLPVYTTAYYHFWR